MFLRKQFQSKKCTKQQRTTFFIQQLKLQLKKACERFTRVAERFACKEDAFPRQWEIRLRTRGKAHDDIL
jgi:hypothetical protein